jgi:serine/threonine protein kinase
MCLWTKLLSAEAYALLNEHDQPIFRQALRNAIKALPPGMVRDAASLPFAYGPTDESFTGYRYVLESFLEPLCAQYTSATCDIFFGRSVAVRPNGEYRHSEHVVVKVLKGRDAQRHLAAELKGRLGNAEWFKFAPDELWRAASALARVDPGLMPQQATAASKGRIVPVLDFGLKGSLPNDGGAEAAEHVHRAFLVLPKKDGTLLDSLQRERWAGQIEQIDRVRELARQLADALSCLHSRHVVHADLKPRNVTFTSRPEVQGGRECQLIDLDSSFFSGDPHTFSKISSAYCAPEQFRAWTSKASVRLHQQRSLSQARLVRVGRSAVRGGERRAALPRRCRR